MKKILIILTLLLSTLSISAQNFHRKGFSFGVDRDTLLYLIASPFDNWYLNVGGEIHTFIGNTPDAAAQWNKLNMGGRIEVGKWIIPDVAVSLRLGGFNICTRWKSLSHNWSGWIISVQSAQSSESE